MQRRRGFCKRYTIQFREHIITDPNVYLDKDKQNFKIGTREEAASKKWVSFQSLQKQLPDQSELVALVASITMMSNKSL
jgi:hypothetical protein